MYMYGYINNEALVVITSHVTDTIYSHFITSHVMILYIAVVLNDVIVTSYYTYTHLDKGKFAGALPPVSDVHLTILVHPSLTTQDVVDTRCHFFPLVVVPISVGRREG